jgi:hypothetical protein
LTALPRGPDWLAERGEFEPSKPFHFVLASAIGFGIWLLRRIAIEEKVQEVARLFEFNSLHE